MKLDSFTIIVGLIILLVVLAACLLWQGDRAERVERRMARITNKKTATAQKSMDALSLRRKAQGKSVPFLSKLIDKLPTQTALKARLERAGLELSPDICFITSASVVIVFIALTALLKKTLIAGILLGIILGVVIPYFVIGVLGAKRLKKFLILFPDAIDFIVRGLRSGLPVTESMNIVGKEMQEPIGSIFAHIGESVKLGVSVDKALQDTAKKLNLTEFNFFVTSIILQRETGGNLSEILNNLAEVLRTRLMMRLKIKAMSSEAKASAIIVGSLPFIVISALMYISPDYLTPLIETTKGNLIALGCACSLMFGIGVMIKMTKFEI